MRETDYAGTATTKPTPVERCMNDRVDNLLEKD